MRNIFSYQSITIQLDNTYLEVIVTTLPSLRPAVSRVVVSEEEITL